MRSSEERAPRQAAPGGVARSRRERARTIAAFVIGGVAALFAVLNLDEVEVHWIVGTWSTPLIIVIAVSLLVGAGLGWIVARRRAAR